jgi:tetratricopeptide (TPR) repeat protein
LQQQGMEMMLASGKASAEAVAEMNYFLGEWAYDAQQWARARQYFEAARGAGYTGGNSEGLTAESYFKERQFEQGLTYLEGVIAQRSAAGQQPPEAWLKRAQGVSYGERNTALANKWSASLVAEYPTVENWRRAWVVVDELNDPDPKAKLDLFRLMALTNAMTERGEFAGYLDLLDPRIMASEAGRVLAAAKSVGAITDADPDFAPIKTVVDQRASAEVGEAAGYAREASGAATGRPAENAGDLYLGLEDFAKAEEMFQLALTKGGIDRDTVLTRLGIAQARQGKNAEAKATFAQVSGARAGIAQLWSAYIDSKA